MTFQVPYVPTNATSWGPPADAASSDGDGAGVAGAAPPSRFASLPYAPFGRSDRLGRCADFTTQSFARTGDATSGHHRYRNNDQRGRRGERDGERGTQNLEFQYKVTLR